MIQRNWLLAAGVLLVVSGPAVCGVDAAPSRAGAGDGTEVVEFFRAIDDGRIDAKFIAKNDREARVLITNKGPQPLTLQLPAAFAGVPVLAQAGGFGGGRGGGRGATGGGTQSVGGGMMGGGGGMMGGGGMFSVPPEHTAKIDVPVLCLDHGKRNPSSSIAYAIVPAAAHVDRPAVVELLKGFGSGRLDHGAAQAAVWHLNNDLSWAELAAKLQGTRRSTNRPPYFSREQIRAARMYAGESQRLAELNREEHERAANQAKERELELASRQSEQRSTDDEDALEPGESPAEAAGANE